MSTNRNPSETSIRVICLKVVLKRVLEKNVNGDHEVNEECQVYRFNANTSLKEAFEKATSAHPNFMFVEVYEPKSCVLTSERL